MNELSLAGGSLPACFPSRSHKQYKSILMWMSHSVCSSTHVFLTLISTQSIGIWTSFGSFLAHGVFKLWDYYLYYAAVVFIKQLHVSQINECLLFPVPLFRVPLYFYCLMCFFYRRTCVVPPHDLWSLTCHSKCKKLYALCSALEFWKKKDIWWMARLWCSLPAFELKSTTSIVKKKIDETPYYSQNTAHQKCILGVLQ